jgi:Tol biopolymer transport system component
VSVGDCPNKRARAGGLLAAILVAAALLAVAAPANATPVPGENGRIVLTSYPNTGAAHAELLLLPVPFSFGGGTLSPPIATSATERHRHPTWSPDRTKIAYARGASTANPSRYDIFVQDLTKPVGAGNPVNITQSAGSNEDRPAWAPNGTYIAFERGNGVTGAGAERDIVVSLTNGGGQTDISQSAGVEGKPAWDPTSSTIYYEKGDAQTTSDNTNIVRRSISFPGSVPTVGPETLAVVDDAPHPEIQPAISPDGSKICYGTGYPGSPTTDIKVAAITGTPASGSKVSLSTTAYYCTWSPDSTMVAYTAGAGSAGDLVMVRADGSSPSEMNLTSGVADIQTNADWAPDGRPDCPNLTTSTTRGQPVSIPVACNDTGPEYERTNVREFITEDPQNGTADQDLAGDPVTYTPNAGFVGVDTFEIGSFDEFGFGSDRGTVVVTVTEPPPGGGGGADTTPPAGTLAGKGKQDVDKLKLTVGSNEAATASGQATVSVAGAKKPVTSKTATATISANGTAKLKFKFKKKTLKKIKKQLEKGEKPKAAIAVTFTDAAGNQATASKTVKLKD